MFAIFVSLIRADNENCCSFFINQPRVFTWLA